MDEPSQSAVASADERAAMRGFLQRCEVRLSTMHRVATALLSGAGILVLLPALERDAVLQVLRALLAGPVSWSRALLAVAVPGLRRRRVVRLQHQPLPAWVPHPHLLPRAP